MTLTYDRGYRIARMQPLSALATFSYDANRKAAALGAFDQIDNEARSRNKADREDLPSRYTYAGDAPSGTASGARGGPTTVVRDGGPGGGATG